MRFYKFILLLLPFLLNGQSIQVIDSETKTPVSYAEIEIYELDVQLKCNMAGEVRLTSVPPSFTLIVSAIGYLTKNILVNEFQSDVLVVEVEKTHLLLNEVIISPTTGIIQQHNLSNVVLKQINNPNSIGSSNLMGTVASVPGVYSIYTGAGISKPVIRGMSGLKVLTFLNGLRIENQQWANDHGVNFTDLGIKTVEIVKGPSSLLYGADALGGVLYFVDEDYTSPNTQQGSVETRFESNSLSTSTVARLKMAGNNFRFNVFAGYKNAADYQIPNGAFIGNSRFKGKTLKTALGYNKNRWIFNLRYNHNSNQIGLPGHTHSANPDPSDFQSSVQNRDRAVPFQLISDHYLSIENKLIFDKSVLKLVTGYTSNSLTEHEEKVTIPGIKMLLTNIPYNLSFSTNINEHLKWISGAQGMIVKNKNDSSAENILLPNSSSIDYGTYSLLQFSKELFETQIGVRYDYREISADEIGSKNFSKINGSVGLVYQTGLYTFRTNFSSGFRPPHISEMLANGVHHGTNRYEIGSQDLESEYANQLDFSLDYNTAHLNVNINPFYNTFKNYIYINPTGEVIDGYENYPVYRYAQTASATTYGTEIYFHYHPHFAHRLHLEQDFSFVMGEDQYKQPLPLIPQTRINTNLKYEFGEQKAKFKIETLQLQRTHFLDKNEVASFETTSDDYEIYNLEANFSYTSKKTVYLKLGIRNIFNKRYINHLSNLKNIGLPGAGTNVYFAINYILN